ncbi:AAA family ATPase [Arthrospira platensis]|uniref:ATPase dynein-related AAA domain-containing protein n=1 Tax=Limnospira platensis NIES-46 TaxID=1236695 RepID=A0A5M3TB76_LIMPL|nr:AAA family ATPase [Arthrospira platensis]AMW30814.1 AAA family ATPase [Arthrospira platensis YZ]KDR55202.1 ATPase AAA [Arthrospira platensis str. Paraca]MBD2670134.1 AAA family ATPase [Arthrospira platensis FACHB-439]MBD2710641.1 AAA family ATPase [Arthrospira platensis FACHB-835]MDF2208142.1 AAA family ATPase [Arthrospira platensis NCB002]MDT9295276.1 AAA family ATPase [Arthrospira platensis PCC 7345]MDT9310931.1 AAA family ATPase [Limnospira sp. Paracas R14]QQW28729.1 AAA family ATPase
MIKNLAIVGGSCLVGGAAVFFISPSRDAWSTIFGSTLGGLGGATFAIQSIKKSSEEVIKTQQQIQDLKQEHQQLLSKVKEITDRHNKLTQKLSQTEGQLTNKRHDLNDVQNRVKEIEQQEQDLKVRLERLRISNPQLETLEKIAAKIGELSQNKSGLEGEVTALNSQLQELANQRNSLAQIEVQYHAKTAQLRELTEQIKARTEALQTLQTRQAELEVIRASYDALSAEQQHLQTRIEQLRPEIQRLEGEKQRILQVIQQHQQDYQQIENFRRQIRNLNSEIRRKILDLQDIDHNINTANINLNSLRVQNAQLQEEKQRYKEEIDGLKGELANLSNSTEVAMQALKDKLWNHLPTKRFNIGNSVNVEQQFLQSFTEFLNLQGLTFPRRVVNAFHTSLKVQDISALVVLAGISGTGKSELPQRYANFIGAQCLTLAVQPRWDSPQDLQGFYNYIEKKFKPTDLMRGLYQYNHDNQMQNRIVIVLLDEMNLARVEYYFSDFLSKLESRRSGDTYLEIDLGSLPLREEERRLRIPEEFLFVGTMNEDETTQTLSDKVLDRANVLTFGKPENLRLREDSNNSNQVNKSSGYLDYEKFKAWRRRPQVNSPVVRKVKEYLDQANNVMEKIGHPFAHRVYQAITQYVVNYPGVSEVNSAEFRYALADQFGQKLLPKLRGLMIDDYHEELEEMKQLIEQLGDEPLTRAFERSRNSSTGQFEWKGLIYPEE